MKLSDAQRLDWLRLIRSDNIGPRTFRTLINKFGGAGAALEALPDLARQRGRLITIADLGECEREMERLSRIGARLVCLGESDYPVALRAIDAPPPVLTVLCTSDVLTKPGVAIVGSRNASAAGLTFAERMATELGAAGYVTVSGLARGIDARVHRASRTSGTIAVLAGGIDKIYPPEHSDLADEIAATGAVISEMPFGCEPRGRDFPRRNRIVSGIALGTIVIEAARRSGSLITARFAVEQGREVFAVPGSPLDPRAEGTNDLLRQGATLCTGSQDVLDALAPIMRDGIPEPGGLFEHEPVNPPEEPLWDEIDLFDDAPAPRSLAGHELDEPEASPIYPPMAPVPHAREPEPPATVAARVLALLGPAPVNIDDLARLGEAPIADIRMILLDLELDGRLERHGGNLVSLTGPPDPYSEAGQASLAADSASALAMARK